MSFEKRQLLIRPPIFSIICYVSWAAEVMQPPKIWLHCTLRWRFAFIMSCIVSTAQFDFILYVCDKSLEVTQLFVFFRLRLPCWKLSSAMGSPPFHARHFMSDHFMLTHFMSIPFHARLSHFMFVPNHVLPISCPPVPFHVRPISCRSHFMLPHFMSVLFHAQVSHFMSDPFHVGPFHVLLISPKIMHFFKNPPLPNINIAHLT